VRLLKAIKRRDEPETRLQKQLAEEFHTTLPPEVFWTAIGHGRRNINAARKLKRMGVRAGIPDLFFAYSGRSFFIELKSATGSPSPEQRGIHAWLDKCRISVAVCKSANEVYRQLDNWGIPTRISAPSLESRMEAARRTC
jgi:hypothetical protein